MKKVLSEREIAENEYLDAKEELDRVRNLFDYASSEYFDLINSELTLAKKRYSFAIQKLKFVSAY